VCDLVYTIWIDRLERWVMVGQIGAVIAATTGTKTEATDWPSALALFDEWLASPLTSTRSEAKDPETRELEAALGIG